MPPPETGTQIKSDPALGRPTGHVPTARPGYSGGVSGQTNLPALSCKREVRQGDQEAGVEGCFQVQYRVFVRVGAMVTRPLVAANLLNATPTLNCTENRYGRDRPSDLYSCPERSRYSLSWSHPA